ncbi:MAG TPA: HWE histidine kinase domain-containing protein, partial [Candidatus Cybelea sp.]
MKRHAMFFSTFTAVMLVLPAFAADGASGLMEVRWGKNAFNFEGMPSGPQPLRNLSRLPNGKANNRQLVGDYRNPILTPEAAAVVKQKGELAVAGKGFPTAYDQCRLITPPSTFAMQLTLEREEPEHLLMREVNHRAKNMLSVVDSIAHHTAAKKTRAISSSASP